MRRQSAYDYQAVCVLTLSQLSGSYIWGLNSTVSVCTDYAWKRLKELEWFLNPGLEQPNITYPQWAARTERGKRRHRVSCMRRFWEV